MKTVRSGWSVRYAARILQQGGIIAYPTEAVYGLGCLPGRLDSVSQLLKLKRRSANKGLILVANNFSQLQKYLMPVDSLIMQRISQTWPGPVTWILPALESVSPLIRGNFNSLAVRISSHPLVAELCQQCNSAIISTSANISGHKMTYTAFQVRQQFGEKLDYILNGSPGGSESPTVIRDAITGKTLRH